MMVHRKADLDRARQEHDQHVDLEKPTRENDLYVPSRSEDRSFWWRASWYLQKYIILWAPIVWAVTALGFGLVTPTKRADELKDQLSATTTMLQREIDSLRIAQLRISEKQDLNERSLVVLVRQACIDRRVSQYDKQLIGLVDSRGECIR